MADDAPKTIGEMLDEQLAAQAANLEEEVNHEELGKEGVRNMLDSDRQQMLELFQDPMIRSVFAMMGASNVAGNNFTNAEDWLTNCSDEDFARFKGFAEGFFGNGPPASTSEGEDTTPSSGKKLPIPKPSRRE